MAKYIAEVVFDPDMTRQGWDGDYPLDGKRSWAAYTVTLTRICPNCDHPDHEFADSLSNTWISDDSFGERYLWGTIRQMIGKRIRKDNVKIEWERAPID